MSVIERCTFCGEPMDDRGYVRDGERIDHADPCFGLRLLEERDAARAQLRGAVEVIADLLPAWLNGWEPGANQDIIDRAEAVLGPLPD